MFKSKSLVFIALFSASFSAFAVPNVWRSGFGQGITEYSIQDAKGQTLWVVCNPDAEYASESDHGASFETKSRSYENSDSKYPLTFLLDGKNEVIPPKTTNWRNGANAWQEFSKGVAKAKKIEVFINNKKVTTFTPTASSIKSVASNIASCTAKFYR